MSVRILIGDCREKLRELADASVNCCVTSPPYFGLRDYGCEGQMGLEPTPDEFVAGMVGVFQEVRRVLRDDGTLWLNIGDSYAASATGAKKEGTGFGAIFDGRNMSGVRTSGNADKSKLPGVKPKDLIGIPWMLAFALRADGWYLRQDIIWSKPNPMPESVRDRCTKAHEYLFLLSKSQRYYFDAESIAEPVAISTISRLQQDVESQSGSDRVPGKTNGAMKAVGRGGKNAFRGQGSTRARGGQANRDGRDMREVGIGDTRNKRSVWEVATQPYSEAHFATYPPALIEPCILAGCPVGGTVLDPFGGAGTTGLVADTLRGGLRDAMLSWFKATPKPWSQMGEREQRDVADSADRCARQLVKQTSQIIAAGERPCIVAQLIEYKEKDGVEARLKLPSKGEVVAALHEACGREVLLVTSGEEEFQGEAAPAEIQADQPTLGIGAEYEVAA